MVLDLAGGVVIGAVDVPVEHGDIVVGREDVHDRVAVGGEPLPVGAQVEQRTMGEDDDRRRLRVARQVAFQPRRLRRADDRLAERDVVEGHEVNAAMIERVVRLAEVLAEERAAVERRVVLAGDVVALLHV